MGRIKLDTINEFARQGYLVNVTCSACGNQVEWHPIALMGELQKRRVSLSVERIEQRLKCSGCGARKAIVRPRFSDDA